MSRHCSTGTICMWRYGAVRTHVAPLQLLFVVIAAKCLNQIKSYMYTDLPVELIDACTGVQHSNVISLQTAR